MAVTLRCFDEHQLLMEDVKESFHALLVEGFVIQLRGIGEPEGLQQKEVWRDY